jgi:hypothetical protein
MKFDIIRGFHRFGIAVGLVFEIWYGVAFAPYLYTAGHPNLTVGRFFLCLFLLATVPYGLCALLGWMIDGFVAERA